MADEPTFSLFDDYVALMELSPAARTVYMLLRCNASFGRRGVVEHTVHVTASWFTEMTSHWKKPLPASTARTGIRELIDKGVLIRLNEPQDGSGYVLAFVSDPRGTFGGPVNGFEHAKRVSRRCGTKAYYLRKDDLPGMPSVTGVRLGRKKRSKNSDSWNGEGGNHGEPQAKTPAPERAPGVEEERTLQPHAEKEPDRPAEMTEEMEEFARLLEERSGEFSNPKLRLMTGACRRLAEAARPALERGWSPEALVRRLVSELNSRINSPERFLLSKIKDIGNPPKSAGALKAVVTRLDGLREADVQPKRESQAGPSGDDKDEMERIRRRYQERKARRALIGSRLPRKF